MALTGYLTIPNIPGESLDADHEDTIEVHGMHWRVRRRRHAGSGRNTKRARVSALTVHKFYDKASPYLALAAMRGESFDEITFDVARVGGPSGSAVDYLTITMTYCTIDLVENEHEMHSDDGQRIHETVAIAFEKIEIVYREIVEDGSSIEHEIDFDLAAGV